MKTLFVVLLLIISIGLSAQVYQDSLIPITEKPKFEINGFAKGSVFAGFEAFDISNAYGEFGLKSSFSGNSVGFFADLRVRDGVFFGEHQTIVNLKEAYAEYSGNYFGLSLGNRILNYGRATGINPTDNICPKDYFFLSSDAEDMKMSNFMLKTNVKPISAINLELAVIPIFKPSVYRYDLFDMGEYAVFAENKLPEISFNNMSYSAHLDATLTGIDFSLTAFHGFDPYYGFNVIGISMMPTISVVNQAAFYKKNSFGLDFSIPVKSCIIVGEAAYNQTSGYNDNIFTPNPDMHYVLGIEKDVYGVKIIAEYIGKYVFDYAKLYAPSMPSDLTDTVQLINYMTETVMYESAKYNQRIFNQYYEISHSLMLNLHRTWLWETMTTDLTMLYNLSTEEKMLRANITWKASDELGISLGGQYMDGPENSIYNLSGKVMSGLWLGMKYSF